MNKKIVQVINDLHNQFRENKKRNKAFYLDVESPIVNGFIPAKQGSNKGFRLKAETELTKVQQTDEKTMKAWKCDNALNMALKAQINSLNNINRRSKLLKS